MKRRKTRQLGVGSWYATDPDNVELAVGLVLSWNTYGARYLDGWVVKAKGR